jgi:hypothetical protein
MEIERSFNYKEEKWSEERLTECVSEWNKFYPPGYVGGAWD